MIVTRSKFHEILDDLWLVPECSVDTETTGLRPYHGDKLFSVIVTAIEGGEPPSVRPFYFNFQPYEGLDPEYVLLPEHMERLREFFALPKTWAAHNAPYDMHILAQDGITLGGTIHCTKAIGLVEYNEHQSYALEASGERIGIQKDNAVSEYITKNKLYETRQGANQAYTHPFYDKVPFNIITKYGLRDGEVCAHLYRGQSKKIGEIVAETADRPHMPTVQAVLENERRLTRTVFRMERLGIRIDRPYCVRAASYELDRGARAMAEFKRLTGADFKNSGKLFAEVFHSERDLWGVTDKGAPSFESDVLKRLANPAAKEILKFRDAKSNRNYYLGFLYHADADDIVHPHFNQDGAGHGRFSSSGPNFQNLTRDGGDLGEEEFCIKRAIIPRPGKIFIMPDYDQMEYRMMFDVACKLLGRESNIVREINNGKDPHQATADIVTAMGTPLSRQHAKNGNFAFLYGSGDRTLAATIGSTLEQARKLKSLMRQGAPEVENYVNAVIRAADQRGFIHNWFGRRCYFPDARFTYRAPNYHISGGCADVTKIVMNKLDEVFLTMKSKMVMTVHDELPCEVDESEVATVPRMVVDFMENTYPWKYLQLTAGMKWSEKNLADKKKGYPV